MKLFFIMNLVVSFLCCESYKILDIDGQSFISLIYLMFYDWRKYKSRGQFDFYNHIDYKSKYS